MQEALSAWVRTPPGADRYKWRPMCVCSAHGKMWLSQLGILVYAHGDRRIVTAWGAVGHKSPNEVSVAWCIVRCRGGTGHLTGGAV